MGPSKDKRKKITDVEPTIDKDKMIIHKAPAIEKGKKIMDEDLVADVSENNVSVLW